MTSGCRKPITVEPASKRPASKNAFLNGFKYDRMRRTTARLSPFIPAARTARAPRSFAYKSRAVPRPCAAKVPFLSNLFASIVSFSAFQYTISGPDNQSPGRHFSALRRRNF